MAKEYLDIPGNIKQMYLPFVLNPFNPIHSSPIKYDGTAVSGAGASYTPFFSFRPIPEVGEGITTAQDSFGFLHIAPNSFYKRSYAGFNQDIGNLLIYSSLYDTRHGNSTTANAKDILLNIPFIGIREYQQDAKLNLLLNLFNAISAGIQAGSEAANSSNEEFKLSQFATHVWEFTKKVFDDIPVILKASIAPVIAKINFLAYQSGLEFDDYVLRIPYIFYYRIISATSTCMYEIPYNGKILYETYAEGWNKKRGLDGLTTSTNTMLGQMVNFFGSNIRVNTTPTWDGITEAQSVKVDVNFQLYNDEANAAVKNFIFVNTLFPNAKWLQYHIFQHSPSLYDIKIDGINRLFMCQGDFKCEQKGVLRKPSKYILDDIFYWHKNQKATITRDQLTDLIRIPDIYDITITFTSLLPNNFNNYLFSVYGNDKMKTISGDDLHTESYWNVVANGLGTEIQKRWKDTAPQPAGASPASETDYDRATDDPTYTDDSSTTETEEDNSTVTSTQETNAGTLKYYKDGRRTLKRPDGTEYNVGSQLFQK